MNRINPDNASGTDEDKLATSKDDTAIIAECMSRMQTSLAADNGNRNEALDDLAFLKGDQWEPHIRQARKMDGRPCLTINKLPTSLHQVTNSQRQNVPSIKVHPTSEGANQKIAEVVQGGIRHIEYKSNADTAKDTAVNSAAAIGIGYFRLVTQYVREDGFDQEIAFKRIRNTFTVYDDPSIVEVDGSDRGWCIISSKVPRTEFVLQFPDADPCDFTTVRGLGDRGQDWITTDQVRVAEYYRIHQVKETLVMLSNGETGWKKDLLEMPEGVTIAKERQSLRSTVQWFKLSATQVLERADIPCKWIPVFQVLGDEIDIDGKITRSGLIRNAKDPARMYNFWMTSATEEVGLRPKAPYIGAEGQFEGHENKWKQANSRSFPYLEYKPKSLGGMLAPPPQRQPMADVPTGVLAMAAHASDDIKATTGIFDASLGARSNETSGIAIKRRDQQGETSTYHYTDNLNTTLRFAGRCILDMWPKIYDGTRTLEIMGRDGKVSTAEINKPEQEMDENGEPKLDEMGKAIETIMNDMSSVAEYSCTIDVGPSYDTLRQEAVDGMIATAQSWPKLMDIAGDKVVRSMDWPMSDEIADRIERTLDPSLLKGDDQAGKDEKTIDTPHGPMPIEQVPSILAQMDQQLKQMDQALQEAEAGITKTKLDNETKVRIAELNNSGKMDIEELKGMIQIMVNQMVPPPALVQQAMTTGEGDPPVQQEQPAGPPDEQGQPVAE